MQQWDRLKGPAVGRGRGQRDGVPPKADERKCLRGEKRGKMKMHLLSCNFFPTVFLEKMVVLDQTYENYLSNYFFSFFKNKKDLD